MWHVSTAQRSLNAKKAAMTRAGRHEKPFGGKRGHHKGNHNAFKNLTHEQRVTAAKKAAETRRAGGH
jgi:hypothetical protein